MEKMEWCIYEKTRIPNNLERNPAITQLIKIRPEKTTKIM